MYKLETSNFFYVNSRIARVGFWTIGLMNSISNINWLILRFFSINQYELSFFLVKSRSIYSRYTDVSFTNRCVATFSKYYKYFFTTKLMEEDHFLVENSLSNIEIINSGFYYKKNIYLLNILQFYNTHSSLSIFKPLIPLLEKTYLFLYKLSIHILNNFFVFMYLKSFIITTILLISAQRFFILNGYN